MATQGRQRSGGKGTPYERFNSLRADGSEVVRLRPPADHVGRATEWLRGKVGDAALMYMRLTFRHDPSCPKLADRRGLCRCRPELWCNGELMGIPDSVFGTERN